jgi:UDP-N-acetylglucosamine--N-acetylmuramyl-(pentapeptide) pyrophosphoryl-undecaprenol N-acetylglucosamine transferase
VKAFLEDMPKQFGAADLILSRSGASTVAELAAAGKPSLLVPFPQAADDHQRKNAEVLAKAGAAMLMLEQQMTAGALLDALRDLLQAPRRLQEMGLRARALAHPDAASQIARMVVEVSLGSRAKEGSLAGRSVASR